MIRRPRPFLWLREHPWITDVAIATGAVAIAVALHGVSTPESDAFDPREPTWWSLLLAGIVAAPIVLRRRMPIVTAWVVLVGYSLVETLAIYSGGFVAAFIAIYSLGAYSDGRRRAWNVAGLAATIGLGFALEMLTDRIESYDPNLSIANLASTYGIMIVVFVIGDNMRRRRSYLDHLSERAERAERERDLLAREHVAEERARIARELHDVVAHSVSGIIIHAQAASRSLEDDPDTSRELLGSIEHTGRQAMDELRRVLGVLRDDGDDDERELTPQPSLADLDELISSNDDLPIVLTVSGELEHLPPGVGLSVYRILQEAFTNIRRHAGRVEHVAVVMATSADGLVLTIDDDGRGAASAVNESDAGYGLIGMNERVTASRGDLSVGPRPGGGWRVTARFPNGAP